MANKNYRQHRLIVGGVEYVDLETLAPLLGRCEEQVRRMARNGVIPCIKADRRWWFDLNEVSKTRHLKSSTVQNQLQELGF